MFPLAFLNNFKPCKNLDFALQNVGFCTANIKFCIATKTKNAIFSRIDGLNKFDYFEEIKILEKVIVYKEAEITKSLYKREHISTIKNFYNIPILNNQNDLKNFILESIL